MYVHIVDGQVNMMNVLVTSDIYHFCSSTNIYEVPNI